LCAERALSEFFEVLIVSNVKHDVEFIGRLTVIFHFTVVHVNRGKVKPEGLTVRCVILNGLIENQAPLCSKQGGTMLQAVRFLKRLLDFSVDLILPAALWPRDRLSL
jgi:hypothetical protein